MDFYVIRERTQKKDSREIYPEFIVKRSKDLMIRGRSFYAVWNPETGLWSTDEYDVQTLVDKDLWAYKDKLQTDDQVSVKTMSGFSSNSWLQFRNYIGHVSDNYKQLDEALTFADTKVTKEDYISRRLPYSLSHGDCPAFKEILETLYDEEEARKILWCIGSVVAGDSKRIQKFAVMFGDPGSGKGTILEIVQQLFPGYCVSFNAKDLTSSSNQFSTEIFKSNPLVAIDPDADLSRIEDNTKLNTIVSHEIMLMNEKHKPTYNGRANCFLFLGSNKPVKITDAKSGVIRRLIDISPSGRKIAPRRYHQLRKQIGFELGAIAQYCLDIYSDMGEYYYENYKPLNMMFKTDEFFNFVEDCFSTFKSQDGVSLKAAYAMYKEYCEDSGAPFKLQKYKFREELKNYFRHFDDQARVDGKQIRSWYSGFRTDKFEQNGLGERKQEEKEEVWVCPEWLRLESQHSLLDDILADQPAQYADDGNKEHPLKYSWANVKTLLRELDTSKLHHVKTPLNLICVDFDKKDAEGKKNKLLNLKAASEWKETYAELSKGGEGLHLMYWYEGDVNRLKSIFGEDIEIKVFRGNASLRRRVSQCNAIPIATLTGGLPLKEERKKDDVINYMAVENEKELKKLIVNQIEQNLRKEVHGNTTQSINFIRKILDDAYGQPLPYDVTELRPRVLALANHSSHNASYCVTQVSQMHFQSKDLEEPVSLADMSYEDERIVFFDIEVFPNLVVICYKFLGDSQCFRLINPKSQDLEHFLRLKLVGFNNLRYDNFILWGIYTGKTVAEIYELSQALISGSRNAGSQEAKNISYTDIFDFLSKKQSLKKWEIALGFHHQELGLRWDKEVPEDLWNLVAEYCENDVRATEALWLSKQGQADWKAREILADISGLTVNDSTNSHTTRIIFGGNRHPQNEFNYRNMGDMSQEKLMDISPDLSLDPAYTRFTAEGKPIFPGYTYDAGKSLYRGEEVGEGGYVYAEPGIHRNVALLDIASMHPSSIVAENLFGDTYTQRFKDILQSRIYIKHKDFDSAKGLFDGKLAPYLDDPNQAKALSGALKIAINSVYGLTSASFDNPFRDIRNRDNIVAKRGALFMVNLKHEVQNRGFTVAHIKTDSIKIPNATPEIIQFVFEYGKLYGYTFEHEATYEKMCLVNNAVYIAKYAAEEDCRKQYGYIPEKNVVTGDFEPWTATGTQFQVPYVFKTLFSKEPVTFDDLCETKAVTTALYLDMNEGLPDVSEYEKELAKCKKEWNKAVKQNAAFPDSEEARQLSDKMAALREQIAPGHKYLFVGKTGRFCPVQLGAGGGLLCREKEGEYFAATGAKEYRWLEAETVRTLGMEKDIDRDYFDALVNEAVDAIDAYGDFELFVSDTKPSADVPPWQNPCGDMKYKTCFDCPHYHPIDSITIDDEVMGGDCKLHHSCDLDYDLGSSFFELN